MEQLTCPISEWARKTPHAPALICDKQSFSYLELDRHINSVCNFLQETGVKKEERIAFIAKTHSSTLFLLFALFRLGAVACPLSPRLPQEPLYKSLEHLKISHIFDPEILPLTVNTKTHPMNVSASATLLFTAGSSGTPKAACITFTNHHYNAIGVAKALKLEPTSRWLLSLPLFHVSGISILFRCFTQGATVVLSHLAIAESIPQFQITHASFVPTQLYRLLQETELKIQTLQCLLIGGAPCPQELLQEGIHRHLPIITTYGMTEMGSIITLSNAKALPFREVKLENDGEIWVRGDTLFQGYWDSTSCQVIQHPREDWFPTKDLGKFTLKGNLEIIGRKDRQFISGGENIQPEEIEKALCAIPGIRQAYVLPMEDKEFGKRPMAYIDDATSLHTLQTVQQALRSTLPSFKHPVAVLPYPTEIGLKPNPHMFKKE